MQAAAVHAEMAQGWAQRRCYSIMVYLMGAGGSSSSRARLRQGLAAVPRAAVAVKATGVSLAEIVSSVAHSGTGLAGPLAAVGVPAAGEAVVPRLSWGYKARGYKGRGYQDRGGREMGTEAERDGEDIA
jgi:hypothetical protein